MWLSNIVLTPGKPNSYSPKPTRDTKGTAERGLKNLKKELELISLDEFTSIQKNVYFFHYPVYGFYGYINSMAQATQTCQHNLFQKTISRKWSLYITTEKENPQSGSRFNADIFTYIWRLRSWNNKLSTYSK